MAKWTDKKPYKFIRLSETEESHTDIRCGLLCFTPDWIQCLKTPAFALLAISSAAFIQGCIVNGILHLVISTIERRYNLRSAESGFVSGGYDIASLICLIPVTYLGGRPKASKPLWIGIGVIVMGIGSLIFSLPHFIAPTFNKNESMVANLCIENSPRLKECEKGEDTKLSSFMWVFLLGNLFHGAGASPLFPLGIAFIDESVVKKKTGIYMGVYYASATLGVAVGYVVGGYFLQLNEGIFGSSREQVYKLIVSPTSKTWIGAWWLGFLIFGILSLIVAIPILAIPPRLPGWQEAKQSRTSEDIINSNRTEAYSKLKELPSAMCELFRNTSFILLNLAGCCEGIILSGSGAFVPKIIQSQFHMSSRTTSLVMGIITVPSAIFGTLVGGGIMRKFELKFVGILKLCVCTSFFSMFCSSCFLITCSHVDQIVGLNAHYYSDRKGLPDLLDPCNAKCGCSRKEFLPICGVNHYTYYSPCFAGCYNAHNSTEPGTTRYSDCACIEEKSDDGMQASSEACKISCPLLPLFLIFMYLSLFCTFVAAMPALTATLRCVKSDQRPLALGMQWMLVRLLGMIPGPILFGLIIDGSCEHWQAQDCSNDEGSCILYDNNMISWSMVLLAYGWKSLAIVLFVLSIFFYKKDRRRWSSTS